MKPEVAARDALVTVGASLFARGLTHGSTGNLSMRIDDGFLLTPTGVSLGALDAARLSVLDANGCHVAGEPPTKETALHLAMYRERPRDRAVVHLHATHSVAVSILEDTDANDALPPLTAYFAMRVGRLPMVRYFPPGDAALAAAVADVASRHHAMLLANHGPVVSGTSLSAASDAIEELEATARLWLLVRRERVRSLTPEEVEELRRRFGR
ncbi:MAG TPA: 3-oxo-tetronate 4-phosphate decarboxylase [Casimicrobiaceae bacterium]|nr:3-oxo-tetronate 4-phosphate decarboxylase [Casimicrobiaceae bacterium]